MDNENLAGLENIIADHIEAGLAEGFKLAPFYSRRDIGGDRFCCALGMVVRNLSGESAYRIAMAAEELGISPGDASWIAAGFDAGNNPIDNPYMEIGKRLHERYNQTPATAVDAT